MVQIIPAVLSTKEEDFKRDIEKIVISPSFQEGWIHIDFMDNIFVPNLSIDPEVTSKYEIPLKKEAHLMVSHPLGWIEKLAEFGFERVFFHLEAKDDTLECIQAIKAKGIEAGIAINIETPVEKLEPFINEIDLVLVMSIVPGFQGQPFLSESIEKIKKLKEKGWSVIISVDGAVKDENVRQLVDAGADKLIIGSFLLQSKNDSSLKGDIDINVEKIWESISRPYGS